MFYKIILAAFLLIHANGLFAQIQINPPFSMPDVNIIQVGDKAYAFCGTDLDPHNMEIQKFVMPYWRCFSSTDLINWEFESMLHPKDMYMGDIDKCFAGHGAYKNGKWYWYFSNYVKNTGVAVADSPKGPWKDALAKPLLPEDISTTKEYDGCIFTDDDKQSYIVYGSWTDKKICYHIAPLNEDMVSLKKKPVKIQVNGIPDGREYIAVDAPFMHKHNGLYYLSWRKPYAVSKNINGPFEFVGFQDAKGHGGFFDFNNQNFVNYTSLKKDMRIRYRFSSLAYVHYKKDGSIAPMESIIKEYGVGQYDANWPAIQAEWFMAKAEGPKKYEFEENQFEVINIKKGDYLNYPNIKNVPHNAVIELTYASENNKGGEIIVKAYKENGPVLGTVTFSSTGSWTNYKKLQIPLDKNPAGKISISLVFNGESGSELIRVDSFRVLK